MFKIEDRSENVKQNIGQRDKARNYERDFKR